MIIKTLKSYCKFDNDYDVYVLLAIARKKYNPLTNSQEVVFREIIKKPEDIERKYNKLVATCNGYRDAQGKKFNYYIYVSVNPRNSLKAGYQLLRSMLTWLEVNVPSDVCTKFKRIDSLWYSVLMQPQSKAGRGYFLFDIDTKSSDVMVYLSKILIKHTNIILIQESRNGYHIVTEPFDKRIFTDTKYNSGNDKYNYLFEIKIDALLYVDFIDNTI